MFWSICQESVECYVCPVVMPSWWVWEAVVASPSPSSPHQWRDTVSSNQKSRKIMARLSGVKTSRYIVKSIQLLTCHARTSLETYADSLAPNQPVYLHSHLSPRMSAFLYSDRSRATLFVIVKRPLFSRVKSMIQHLTFLNHLFKSDVCLILDFTHHHHLLQRMVEYIHAFSVMMYLLSLNI